MLDIKPYIGYCDAFPNMKAGWLDALGSDHEAQGDFLPKFSVGATLVHTATGPTNVPRSPTKPVAEQATKEVDTNLALGHSEMMVNSDVAE